MTAYGSIQDAVEAMKEGALDFLAKPVDPDHLLLLVERAHAQAWETLLQTNPSYPNAANVRTLIAEAKGKVGKGN